MKSQYWIKFNYNPWKAKIGDCAIRSIVAATGLDYREVCKRLGVAWKYGKGLIRDTGIDLEDVKRVFGKYFDIIEDFTDNYAFVPDEFKDSQEDDELRTLELQYGITDDSSGITLKEFIDQFENQGAFLVSCIGNPNATNTNARSGGHLVYVQCIPGKRHGFIDSWDSSEMLVDAYMRVIKKEPFDSPLHWKYDHENHKFIV